MYRDFFIALDFETFSFPHHLYPLFFYQAKSVSLFLLEQSVAIATTIGNGANW